MAKISENNLLAQSPYLYLQGAGSDGSDGSAAGVHLRWDFGENLAEKHIPKGNLAAQGSAYYTTAGFNKSNDFVKIYRTSYNQRFPIIIDFATMPPQISGNEPVWRYKNLAPVAAVPSNTCNVLIRFTNSTKYNQIKQRYNPATDWLNFLKNYNGLDDIIEVEVEGRLMFSADVQMQVIDGTQKNITRIESISLTNKGESDKDALFISSRKKYESYDSYLLKEDRNFLLQENDGYLEIDNFTTASNGKIMAENIKYIRFRGDNSFPVRLSLETYHDFVLGKNQGTTGDWQLMTELSLSIDNNEVFNRLEKSSAYVIDNSWPKYINGAKVKVNNYKARWSDNPDEGLRNGVIEYLERSKNADNLEACNQPSGAQPAEGGYVEESEISYLALLKLVAFDFHIARMLGFGYIDAGISNATDKYIYIAVYEIQTELYEVPAKTHTFMTLPVGKTDYKLPVTPEFYKLEYGLKMTNETEIPIWLTNKDGYSKYDNSRAVGLLVKPFTAILEGISDFFKPEDKEYSYVDYTEPIQFGIAYKKHTATQWKEPELNSDPDFQDPRGVNEPVAIIRPDYGGGDTKSGLVYTHLETEEGIHDYAVYGINWFSRVSPLSNTLSTDKTDFPIKNTLVPPLNLGVQLIQKEDPLIFTTQAEQDRLKNLSAADKTLVRLTFEWNNIHASNYWYGKEAEFFFRTEALNFVKGKIKSVTELNEKGLYKIHTESYTISSVKPAREVKPIIPVETGKRYINSFLTTNEEQYQYQVQNVEQFDISGEGAIFTVKASEVKTMDLDNNNVLQVVNAPPILPQVGSIFSVPENASLTAGWSVPLTQKITLKKLSDHTESYTNTEGMTTVMHIGGVFAKATITDILDTDKNGNKIQGSKTGAYWIAFTNYILTPHGDPNVEWYKGSVRIKVSLTANKEEMRVLDVWSIEKKDVNGNATSNLQLIAYDNTFNVDKNYNPIPEFDDDGKPIPGSGYVPIPTGSNIDVNYHPGYRAYFTSEPGFNQSSLLPVTGSGAKQTLIACRSTDPVAKGGKIDSPLSNPAVILAREIIEPVAPDAPEGALFATRPNFYGKASYTFDTKIKTDGGREPYALVFYRANQQIILDTLYEHETVLQIQNDLARIENDTAVNTRWYELVNAEIDANDLFIERNGYRFPNPNNSNYKIPNPDPKAVPVYPFKASPKPGTCKDLVKLAINNAFLPLTEQPVVYQHLKEGYQTSDRKPMIRDFNGELIKPDKNNPGYDGSPMAVKLPNKSVVRFTDYTLDGASTSIFFYYAVEMNNMLAVSDRSKILGPINLINSAPPKVPEIRKFYARPENTITGDTPAILFEINDYPKGEEISKILIYRALNPVDAMTVRTMQLAATIDINDPIIDDFSDFDFYPFGEALYYRLVAIRTIKASIDNNGDYGTEDIPSYPTSLILANIIDVNNPPAPELFYTANEHATGSALENVVIKWNSTAYNGTYYLYQMNNSGNWTKIYHVNNKYSDMQYELPDSLPKTDEDGNTIYYRFKVIVENSSGLFSLEENVLII